MSKTIYNFSAGPSTLPKQATKEAAEAIANFANTGVGILEISHRTPAVEEMVEDTNATLRKLMGIPEDYEIVYLGGGASLQFCMVPMNLLDEDGKADYINTGVWANKALKEAKALASGVKEIATSKPDNYTHLPTEFTQTPGATYLHVTSNNTIYGTEYFKFPKAESGYVVADMSSDILSRPINVKDFGLIYAGAQKNMSCAGVTTVIVRKDILGKVKRYIPTMLNYQTHIDSKSMFNTPPVFAIYVMNRVLHWLDANGGIAEMEKVNIEKSGLLYDCLDNSKLFMGTAAKQDRSRMNIPFVFRGEAVDPSKADALQKEFLAFAREQGLEQLKGHRSVGGFRASLYNAMPLEGVKELVRVMGDFEKKVLG